MQHEPARRWRATFTAVLVVLALALGATACGDSSSSSSSSSPAAQTTTGSSGATTKALDALFAGDTYGKPPSDSPPPAKGKNVWVVITGLATPSAVIWTDADKAAAKALGWKVTIFNGQFSTSRALDGILQAIAAKADGIVVQAVDCAPLKAGLQQARKAGIKLVANESVDCGEQDPSAQNLFDAIVKYHINGDQTPYLGLLRYAAYAQALYVADATHGEGKVIALKTENSFALGNLYAAFVKSLKEVCPGCQIVDDVTWTTAELGTPELRQKIEQSILRNPDANALVVPFDDAMTAGAGAAVQASGRSHDLTVVAGTGLPAAITMIREDKGLDASYGLALGWESYAAFDALNRLFNGEQPQPSGIGLGFYDKDHGLPPAGQAYEPPVDYKALYEEAWKKAAS